MYNIPKTFKLANHLITVIIEKEAPDTTYGTWDDIELKITLFKSIRRRNEIIHLTEEQILNTFWHEVFHAFSFFAGMEQDEIHVQTFANLMRDYQLTKECN